MTSSNPDYPFISDTAGLGITGNPTNLIEENDDTRKFYRADADIYVNLLGSHHFKFGYDREELTSNQLTSYTGDRAITYVNSGSTGDTNVPTPDTLYFFRAPSGMAVLSILSMKQPISRIAGRSSKIGSP